MAPGRREALILAAAGVVAAAAGFLVGPLLLRSSARDQQFRPGGLLDLTGKPRDLAEWQGRVLVCNFWATWCAPCREEIPLLVAARGKFASAGVEIVGIAIDNADKVGAFARQIGISYPVLLAEAHGLDLMRDLGNSSGGLPYTVFFDRRGRPAQTKLGALKQDELEAILARMTVD